MMEQEKAGTDLLFVPGGLIAGFVIAICTYQGVLRPYSFWAPEAAGYFVSVVTIFALRPKARWIAHTMLAVLTFLAFAVVLYHATMSP